MTINLGGLASGIDTESLLSGLLAVERQPLDALQKQQTQITNARATVSAFSTSLSTLSTAAAALSDPSSFAAFGATSTDSAVVASAGGGASAGTYDVTVNAIAREQRTYSNSQSSSTDALGFSGTLSLKVGSGAAIDVTVNAGDSLATIATNISASGARVSASVLYDGTGYHLQVRGLDTGAANSVAFTESGFSLGLSTAANTFQTAQDASLKVDGITVTRPTNQITGVIPGVTLALTKTTTLGSPATVKVAADASSLKTKLKTLVDAYNAVVGAGHVATGYGGTKATNSVLVGNFTIRGSLDRLGRLFGNVVPGTTGKFNTLGSAGLSTTRTGLLQLDDAKLDAAIAEDATSVSRLFVTDPKTGATGVMGALTTTVSDLTGTSGSLIQSQLDTFDAQTKRMTTDADSMQARLDAWTTKMRAQFTAMEAVVSKWKSAGNSLGSLTGTSSSSNS